MPDLERRGYIVPIRIACTMEVYIESTSKAEAARLVREGEWDEPGELNYALPVRPTVAGPVREHNAS